MSTNALSLGKFQKTRSLLPAITNWIMGCDDGNTINADSHSSDTDDGPNAYNSSNTSD